MFAHTMATGPAAESHMLDSLSRTAAFVNHQLAAAGFPSPLNLTSQPSNEDVHRTVECVFQLLQQIEKDAHYREDIHQQMLMLSQENESLSATVLRLTSRLETAEREIDQLNNKISLNTQTLKETSAKLQATKEELKVTKTNYQHARSQYMHEIKKREREGDKIRDRIQKALSDKTIVQKVGMKLLNPLPKTVAESSKLGEAKRTKQDEMYKIVVGTFEEREKEILAENSDLRKLLFSTYQELKGHMKTFLRSRDVLEDDDATEEARFNLPVNLAGSTIQSRLRYVVGEIRDYIAELQERPTATPEEKPESQQDVQMLYDQIEEYRKIIAEQARLLELALSKPKDLGPTHSPARSEYLSGDGDWKELEEQRAQLQEDRRKLTEAAIRMGVERAALQRDRQELEEERRRTPRGSTGEPPESTYPVESGPPGLDTEAFLSTLPKTPRWLRAGKQPTLEDLLETPGAQTPVSRPSSRVPSGSSDRTAIPSAEEAIRNSHTNTRFAHPPPPADFPHGVSEPRSRAADSAAGRSSRRRTSSNLPKSDDAGAEAAPAAAAPARSQIAHAAEGGSWAPSQPGTTLPSTSSFSKPNPVSPEYLSVWSKPIEDIQTFNFHTPTPKHRSHSESTPSARRRSGLFHILSQSDAGTGSGSGSGPDPFSTATPKAAAGSRFDESAPLSTPRGAEIVTESETLTTTPYSTLNGITPLNPRRGHLRSQSASTKSSTPSTIKSALRKPSNPGMASLVDYMSERKRSKGVTLDLTPEVRGMTP
ncbi:Afadin and alpha-actinin-binding-domain-containing protein [Polychytrium aggregatum]|uniref:Afadin and alpha-actinin-binding-domain-containing protein n=1 Tax=Polychytrium aggregatum TaxID=110093 RepID=UPI0022FF2D50|nr:Afadin and alpha-actinin-binding-domain-containing protein [Polychytrium aggregatum]KAI9205485.1 Afadin and alpha-actinin-binding-domain-containing protein [Polychytrium aggregatum]